METLLPHPHSATLRTQTTEHANEAIFVVNRSFAGMQREQAGAEREEADVRRSSRDTSSRITSCGFTSALRQWNPLELGGTPLFTIWPTPSGTTTPHSHSSLGLCCLAELGVKFPVLQEKIKQMRWHKQKGINSKKITCQKELLCRWTLVFSSCFRSLFSYTKTGQILN